MHDFPKILARIKLELELKDCEIAEILDVHPTTYCRWSTGNAVPTSHKNVTAILDLARHCGVEV